MAAAEVQASVGGGGGEKGGGARAWVEDGGLALAVKVVGDALVGDVEEGREERNWGCQLRRSARTKARKAHHAAAQVAVERSKGIGLAQLLNAKAKIHSPVASDA